jgi:hypothetical protein
MELLFRLGYEARGESEDRLRSRRMIDMMNEGDIFQAEADDAPTQGVFIRTPHCVSGKR